MSAAAAPPSALDNINLSAGGLAGSGVTAGAAEGSSAFDAVALASKSKASTGAEPSVAGLGL